MLANTVPPGIPGRKPVEQLAILPQVPLRDRDFRHRLRLDIHQLEIAEKIGLSLKAIVYLHDMRLVPVMTEQVEPAGEPLGVKQVADEDGQPPALRPMDEGAQESREIRLGTVRSEALPETSGARAPEPCRASGGTRRWCSTRTRE